MQRKWCCGCRCVVQKWIRAVSESTKRRARSDITLTVGPGDVTLLCFYNLKTSFKFVFVFNNSSSGFVRTEWLKQLIPKKLIQTSFFFMGSTYFRWWIMEVGWWVMETNKSKQLWEFSLIPQKWVCTLVFILEWFSNSIFVNSLHLLESWHNEDAM